MNTEMNTEMSFKEELKLTLENFKEKEFKNEIKKEVTTSLLFKKSITGVLFGLPMLVIVFLFAITGKSQLLIDFSKDYRSAYTIENVGTGIILALLFVFLFIAQILLLVFLF